ncbi:MAG: GIY-YIG nuclease family protein [Ruminococcus sp.]|nr:GIY-YIG nuclease family protein [Ruminococcus sp.]
MYYVYIIKCEAGELYTGIAADIVRRMKEHFSQSEKCAKYTRSHKAVSLEALWTAENRSLASKLERRIKKLPRGKKLELIECPESLESLCEEGEIFVPVREFSLEEMLNK